MASMPDKDGGPSEHDEWLLLAIRGRRQYGGNPGYQDEPGKVYRYDSFVPNASRLKVGDVVVIRDRMGAKGVARIDRIERGQGVKTRYRCPVCQTVQIKERVKRSPRFRCRDDHVFDTPISETVDCTRYEAHFGVSFVPVRRRVPMTLLRGACPRFAGQNSIQPINLAGLEPVLRVSAPGASALLGAPDDPPSEDAADADPTCPITGSDARERVYRQIVARRGSRSFRDAMLQRYERACAVSGCRLVAVLEAAHIRPYRNPTDNRPTNGLLLRCDLHTLFDLDLLAVEPESLTVHLHPTVQGHAYDRYAGRPIRCRRRPPDRDALSLRWSVFQARVELSTGG